MKSINKKEAFNALSINRAGHIQSNKALEEFKRVLLNFRSLIEERLKHETH